MTGRTFGYARVSTEDQDLSMQISALEKFGCAKIFQEKKSAGALKRPEFNRALQHLRPGDTLVIWKLDRLFRSLRDMLKLHEKMQTLGVEMHSLTEKLETNSPMGKFVFHVLAAIGEFEHNLISERTKAGIAARKEQGAAFGKKTKLTPERLAEMIVDLQDVTIPLKDVADKYGFKSTTSIYQHAPDIRKQALADAGIRKPPAPAS